jgi:hypothetical protein
MAWFFNVFAVVLHYLDQDKTPKSLLISNRTNTSGLTCCPQPATYRLVMNRNFNLLLALLALLPTRQMAG